MAKAYKGLGMEGAIARWYDRTTRKDMSAFRELADRLAALLPPNATVLEIAPGPGFLSIELAKRGLRVQAVDISESFVEIARYNAAAEGVAVDFAQGDAAALPLADANVDLVVCRAAFKNFAQPVKALAEMRRVLRPGGRALVIDLRRDVPFVEIERYVSGLDVSGFSRWLMRFTFRNMLIKRAYPLSEIESMAATAGWSDLRLDTTQIGFEAWTTAAA